MLLAHRVIFLVVVAVSLGGLRVLSLRAQPASTQVVAETVSGSADTAALGARTAQRRELIEVLDRVVAYEHYYRSVYGHFTKLLSRVGFTIPRALTDTYEIRVDEASVDRLLITAFSEVGGRMAEQISIDQDYGLHANFSLPAPRAEYLRRQAVKHLRLLRDAPAHQSLAESGVYRGYFRYETRTDAQDQKSAYAIGVRAPVVGVQLEAGKASGDTWAQDDLAEWVTAGMAGLSEVSGTGAAPPATGQRAGGNVLSTMEEAYLAQKIFYGEIGRYARSWGELTKITDFRFEGREPGVGEVPFGGVASKIPEIDVSSLERQPASRGVSPSPAPTAAPANGVLSPLEIEPVDPR